MEEQILNTEKKVIKKKIYSITVTQFEDGTTNMQRINDGFNILELLGICQLTAVEIKEQFAGNIKPDVITRQVVVD